MLHVDKKNYIHHKIGEIKVIRHQIVIITRFFNVLCNSTMARGTVWNIYTGGSRELESILLGSYEIVNKDEGYRFAWYVLRIGHSYGAWKIVIMDCYLQQQHNGASFRSRICFRVIVTRLLRSRDEIISLRHSGSIDVFQEFTPVLITP